MGRLNHTFFPVFASLLFLCFSACLDDDRSPSTDSLIEVSLFTGIPGVGRLGESMKQVADHTQFAFTEAQVDPESELGKIGVGTVYVFKDVGAKVYFKRDGVAMITTQEPFKGVIKGKKIRLFTFSVPPVSDWESLLLKELGAPQSRASGGRLGSEGLFYNWGDISYNRMGPNELALYRNPEITSYRLKNFGRELQLFPGK